jgi:hypothetical protein
MTQGNKEVKRGARMGAWDGRRGPPTPSPSFLQKSAESLEKKGLDFLTSAKNCKKLQKSAQDPEKTDVRFWTLKIGKGIERPHAHPRGICKNIE